MRVCELGEDGTEVTRLLCLAVGVILWIRYEDEGKRKSIEGKVVHFW